MKSTRLLLLILPLALSSCSTSRETFHADQLPLSKVQTWQLAAIQGRNIDPGDKVPTIVINPEAGTATGHAYCNTYTFRCTLQHPDQQLDGDYYDLELSLWGSGSLGCPETEKNAEARYLSLLAKATRLRLNATNLTLFQKDKEILHFELQ